MPGNAQIGLPSRTTVTNCPFFASRMTALPLTIIANCVPAGLKPRLHVEQEATLAMNRGGCPDSRSCQNSEPSTWAVTSRRESG